MSVDTPLRLAMWSGPRNILFDEVAQKSGSAPPVIDAHDFLMAPEAHLRALCAHLGIAFSERMLHWRAGPRASDGVWAAHSNATRDPTAIGRLISRCCSPPTRTANASRTGASAIH